MLNIDGLALAVLCVEVEESRYVHRNIYLKSVSNSPSATKPGQFANVGAELNYLLREQCQYADTAKVAKRETENVFTLIPHRQRLRVVKLKIPMHPHNKQVLLHRNQKMTKMLNETSNSRR